MRVTGRLQHDPALNGLLQAFEKLRVILRGTVSQVGDRPVE